MNRPKFHDDQLAYVITLEAMLERASKALRDFADFDPDERLAHPVAVVQLKAKAALKQMREIGGFDL